MSSEAQRRSDEAVRRLREESRLRVGGQNRRRSFAGWCAVATLAGGISLAALDARDAQLQAQDEAEQEVAAQDVARQAADADRRKP
jgi:hypothetical protein